MQWPETADDDSAAEMFRLFKQKLILVCEDNDVTVPASIARKIKIGIGDEGLRRLNASGLTEEQLKDPERIWSFFEDHLRVNINFRIQRLILMQMRQRTEECLDDFVTRARTQALHCEFDDRDLQERIIELVIAGTPIELFRRELLGKGRNLTLADVIKLGRQHEAAVKGTEQLESMLQNSASASVDYVRRRNPPPPKQTTRQHKNDQQTTRECSNCGHIHPPRECPAYESECGYCHYKGHWKKFCRKAKYQNSKGYGSNQERNRPAAVHEVSYDQPEEDIMTSIKGFNAITIHGPCIDAMTSDKAYTKIDIKVPGINGQHTLQVKIDTGANANALPIRTFQQMFGETNPTSILKPSNEKLTAYSGDTIKCYGKIIIQCSHEQTPWIATTFYVVDVPGPVILGLPSCEKLKLVSITCNRIYTDSVSKISTVRDLITQFPEQFD